MVSLFAFYLGGKVKGFKIEVHDIVFGVGEKIEDCYEQIRSQWYGVKSSLHIDAYAKILKVDGYNIILTKQVSDQGEKLFLVNMGGSKEGEFTELHKNGFVVAKSALGALSRSRKKLYIDFDDLHVDNIVNSHKLLSGAIDHNEHKLEDVEVYQVPQITDYYIQLTPDTDREEYDSVEITPCYISLKK